jgi:hypothetical protein
LGRTAHRQVAETGRSRRKRVRVGDKNTDGSLGGALHEEGASDVDSDDDEAEVAAKAIRKTTQDANPLLVSLEEKKEVSASTLASQWFSQPVFGGVDMDALEEDDEPLPPVAKGKGKGMDAAAAMAMDLSDEEEEEEEEDVPQRMVPKTPPARKKVVAAVSGAGGALAAPAMGKEGKGAKGSIKAKAGDDDWTDSVTPSRKRKAEEEFEEVAQHVDRDGSDSDSDVSVEVRAIMSVSDRVGFVSPSLPLWRWTGSRHGPWQESFYLFKGANGPCRMTGC